MRRARSWGLLLGLWLAGSLPGSAETPTLRVRTRASLLKCLEPVVLAFERTHAVRVEVTSEVSALETQSNDVWVDTWDQMTRRIEGGRAREDGLATLGVVTPYGGAGQRVQAVAATTAAEPLVAADFLAFLRGEEAQTLYSQCTGNRWQDREGSSSVRELAVQGTNSFAVSVVDWWLPKCALARNASVEPDALLGSPDAIQIAQDVYSGIISLGQGGYVTVDMGREVVDGTGPDFRVFQTTHGEPVTVYGSSTPEGPFLLFAYRFPCGVRTPKTFSNHCDIDLGTGHLPSARYLRIEDGEIYPCAAGNTKTEGADLDAVEILGH